MVGQQIFQQVGEVIAREHGRAQRNGHHLARPIGLAAAEQGEEMFQFLLALAPLLFWTSSMGTGTIRLFSARTAR